MNYLKNIGELIVENEARKIATALRDNSNTLLTYWNIGKLIVEAQGGEKRAKYGDNLINEWGKKLSGKYGKNYDTRSLRRFRTFYNNFSIWGSVSPKLTWTHYRYILSIKNENERNYYINLVILNNLSVRELQREIKNKSFDRLSYADKEHIEIISDTSNTSNTSLSIKDMIKDPIILKTNKIDEQAIHKYIISLLEDKFLELGTGFTLAGHEYKIHIDNKTYKIDLLFFNYKLNAFVVVEVKTRKIKYTDIGQLNFYVKFVENNIKDINHNNTIGLLIVKEKDKYIVKYTTSDDILVTTYALN